MVMNYAKKIPVSENGVAFDGLPFTISQQSQSGVPVASSVITLSANTTVIDISAMATAGTGGIIGKWGSASVTGTNYDFFVMGGNSRILVVPINTQANGSSVQGANGANGLYSTVAVKTATSQSASVFTAEY